MEPYGPGTTISFRLPHDTPEHVYQYLNERKKKLGRKFSSEIAPLFIQSVSEKALQDQQEDLLEVPIPKGLSEEQLDWLTHPRTQALIGHLIWQMVKQPLKPLEMAPPPVESLPQKDSHSFKTNNAITNFAQKTFLDFDDDDD
ncbi:hypothetical protein [Sporosarcina globispora]|uniref:hypothetical protein n=1 Tax=Sporosarcina globispora TaxID=1459 RepID=UPI0006A9524B|nr:hypothetical protein [Sporosarcina globispora]